MIVSEALTYLSVLVVLNVQENCESDGSSWESLSEEKLEGDNGDDDLDSDDVDAAKDSNEQPVTSFDTNMIVEQNKSQNVSLLTILQENNKILR